MERENWGRRIRAFRKLKGFTQESFAKEIGVSVSILGDIERETRIPTTELIEQIVQVLQITIDELRPIEENQSE
jgi:transcriptional regulator with XRE-family HTH domain